MSKASAVPPTAVGYQAFDRLRAEWERAWRDRVWVEPPHLHKVLAARSVFVFGAPGSGRTMLHDTLIEKCQSRNPTPPLLVDWDPQLPPADASESDCAKFYVDEIFKHCARALLRHIAAAPDKFRAAPDLTRARLAEFIQLYSNQDPDFVDELAENLAEPDLDAARGVLMQPVSSRAILDISPPSLISKLTHWIQRIELERIWILVEQGKAWITLEPERMPRTLGALLKTLDLFDIPGFEFKVLIPAEFDELVRIHSALSIRRADALRLEWSPEQLLVVVERRLAAMFGKPTFTLKQLGPAKELEDYLHEYGGVTPRGWLELVKPYAEKRYDLHLDRALTLKEFTDLRAANPPKLWIDPRTNQVFLHHKPLDIKPNGLKILRYLYEHGKSTRSALWYRGFRGLDREPKSREDKAWEMPTSWRQTLDQNIYRLRQDLESDPSAPTYLVTQPNETIVLQYTA